MLGSRANMWVLRTIKSFKPNVESHESILNLVTEEDCFHTHTPRKPTSFTPAAIDLRWGHDSFSTFIFNLNEFIRYFKK